MPFWEAGSEALDLAANTLQMRVAQYSVPYPRNALELRLRAKLAWTFHAQGFI